MSLIMSLVLLASQTQTLNTEPQVEVPQRFYKLDSMLRDNKFIDLGKVINNPESVIEITENLAWLRVRWKEGNSSFISMLYAISLWKFVDYISSTQVRVSEKPEDVKNLEKLKIQLIESKRQSASLRRMAVASMLYFYGVIPIDGARCGDRTAPAQRLDQFPTLIPGLLEYMSKMSRSDQEFAIYVATDVEAKTAKRRDELGDVVFLCSQGLAAVSYGIRQGATTEAKPKPGQIGRQIDVDTSGYKPEVFDSKVWRPIADKARGDMRARLDGLFASVGAAKK